MTEVASHITAQKTPEHYKTSKMFSDRLVMRLQASGNQAQSGEEIASGDDLRSTRLGAHAGEKQPQLPPTSTQSIPLCCRSTFHAATEREWGKLCAAISRDFAVGIKDVARS